MHINSYIDFRPECKISILHPTHVVIPERASGHDHSVPKYYEKECYEEEVKPYQKKL